MPRDRDNCRPATEGKSRGGLDRRALPCQSRGQQADLFRANIVSCPGTIDNLVPNIVFAHLDSDLPLYLWWQGEFYDPIDSQLWSWVDRLIYDSREWHDVPKQLALLETAQRQARQRVILCDLNWTRLFRVRLALARSSSIIRRLTVILIRLIAILN